MPRREFTVDRMQAGERAPVIGALSRAFYDDPMFGYFLPNHLHQIAGITSFMKAGVVDAEPFDEIWVAHADGKVAGAAVWLPPGAYPRGARRDTLANLRSLPVITRAGRRSVASLKLLAAVDKVHHAITEPHYYLAILGTDPLYQRSGAGSAALHPVLDRCDEEGLNAYLETQKEENLAYYARHSFELVQTISVDRVPPLWTMLRKPR
jgi:GNAT superfamily N-acetyltransferase